MDKPLLIFDGDCGFCRAWIKRWEKATGDKVSYAPSQEVGAQYPDIKPQEFQRAVQLVEPNGHKSSAAEAIYRTLTYCGVNGWLWAYQKVPGFSVFSEWGYSVIAGHRPLFSVFTRWLWGNPAEPASYRHVRWLFLRALSLVYAVAFASFGMQAKGLIGAQGILPAHDFLSQLSTYGPSRFWFVPTLAWLHSSDTFLVGLCVAGVLFSLALFLNVAPKWTSAILWIFYLSIVSVGGNFMGFQWDALLLETGFLAILWSPWGFLPQWSGTDSPSSRVIWLLRWLVFRLMFQSALVKWLSGDTLWRQMTALTVHYQTQPLPNPLSWYVHQWPVAFHKVSCLLVFVIEGLVPLLIFMPRRPRLLAFWGLIGFQIILFVSGNYAYFNLLALVICIPLLEDSQLRSWWPDSWSEPITSPVWALPFRKYALGTVCILVWVLTVISFGHIFNIPWPRVVMVPANAVSSLRSFNSYGLFAVMTPDRPEIILEGSQDGATWREYEFRYKVGNLSRRPAQIAPFHPRLDWQMWFAALGDFRQNPWFVNLCVRLLQGSKPVLALLETNPFPENPPTMIRASLYVYRFTTRRERQETGHWWAREYKGLYCPILSFKKGASNP